jgi:glycosyltransferase involved in cell wall biosynthesis
MAVPLAIVMPSFEPGGTERQMIELIRRLDRRRWDVHVACLRRSGAWLERVDGCAPIVEFPVRSFRRPDALAQMHAFGRWCRERGIAVVHTTDLPSNVFALPAALFAHVPVRIASRRELTHGRSRREIACQRAAYACAHRIVANCRAAADRLRAERVPSKRIRVIHNGVERQAPPPAARPARLRRVVVVANLRPEKGHDVLLRAAAAVVELFPDAHFDIVGDGPELPALRTSADSLRISHAVTFSGHREDVAARLDAADIFVLPSRSEAFPNALLEAMAAGLPVVASGVGGVLEVVDHERNGLLVPPDDHLALASVLGRLMSAPNTAGRLGAAACASIAARYSFARMVESFDSLYSSELARAGRLPVLQAELAAS